MDPARFVYPVALIPGDLVAVVAPSSPFPRDAFFRGLAWVRDRYRLRAESGILARDGYLAGDDDRRAAELTRAMLDPGIKAIVCARGGYGATRIVERLPWDAFAKRPKWLVGFSDITAIHSELCGRGVASIHGPNVTGLGHGEDPVIACADRAAWLAALERPCASRAWASLRVLHRAGGRASGTIVGGNLALLESMAAAGRLSVPDGAVLMMEDVTERPYRIDRMLTALRLGKHLDRLAGIVFGEFTQCDPGPDGRTVEAVLSERTRDLGVPVLAGAPFGHGARNQAFVLGSRATLDVSGAVGSLTLASPEALDRIRLI